MLEPIGVKARVRTLFDAVDGAGGRLRVGERVSCARPGCAVDENACARVADRGDDVAVIIDYGDGVGAEPDAL